MTRMLNGLQRFTLENYSLCKRIGQGQSIDSDPFVVGGHKWMVKVFPNGPTSNKSNRRDSGEQQVYIGLLVVLMSEGNGVRLSLKMTLLDQSGKGDHLTISSFNRGPQVINTGHCSGSPRFMLRDSLEKSSYLRDDCLKIEFTLGVVLPHETHKISPSIVVPQRENFGVDFSAMLKTGEGCDVIFDVRGERFRAHKMILSARSSVFALMFAGHVVSDQQEMVIITSVETQVFKALLHFIYSDSLPEDEKSFVDGYSFGPSVSSTFAAKLLVAADEYDMRCLKSLCESQIWSSISLYRFEETLFLAKEYNASTLKYLCFKYASDNHVVLGELNSFSNLQKKCPHLFSELDDYMSREKLKKELPTGLPISISNCTSSNNPEIRSEFSICSKCSQASIAMADKIDEYASMTVGRMEKGSYLFVVKNYSHYKEIGVKKAIESEEFTVCDYPWTIRFYPSGKNVVAYNAGNVSLYISNNSKDSHLVKFLHEFYVIDQSGKGNHQGYSKFKSEANFLRLKYGNMGGKLHFMNRVSLESSDYLKDDCLKIQCTIGVFTCINHELPLVKVTESNIKADFGKLLESKKGADVVFKVGSESFYAHKWILAAHSSVFRSSLFGCHQPQEIVVPDLESRIFKAMLLFIYTGVLPEEEHEAVSDSGSFMPKSFMGKMLAAADRFDLKRLKKICESRMLERVSEESTPYLLHLADLYHASELKAACLKFAAENRDVVMKSDGCRYLRETCAPLFLELAGYNENPSRIKREELDFFGKILHVAKEYFVGITRLRDASDMEHKIKEA